MRPRSTSSRFLFLSAALTMSRFSRMKVISNIGPESTQRTMIFPIRQLSAGEFPPLLREMPDAPRSLYMRGILPPPGHKLLCVVGSRATSAYGRRACQSLIAALAGYPIAIVSGLALGIDAEAHQAALAAGLPAVAVLPSSCDDASIYPRSNQGLARQILERGGALISENAAPWRPQLYSFPERNRIMAAMSDATLIIEAGEKSGTLITARLALDYNREVLAVPHEVGRETGAGGNRLIREGAALVRDAADVLEALGLKALEPAQLPLPGDLSPAEAAVLRLLEAPLEKDEILGRAGLSARDANIALSSLHLRGLIAERLGKVERARV
ncbi:MAG TPA: DNA-processing protein DprA [Candidatus Paceibacterota bacterium]|nr:DNA-processing protein DprA [Candidatus Paceibacterota bacterium]